MQIFIKLLTGGESIPLTVEPSYSIDHVKKLLEVATKIAANQQIFSFGSAILENGHLLSEYSIQHESTIHLVKYIFVTLVSLSYVICHTILFKPETWSSWIVRHINGTIIFPLHNPKNDLLTIAVVFPAAVENG